MIDYFAHGLRDYAMTPVLPYARPRWEFQAVLSGELQRWRGYDDEPDPPRSSHLWISPPEQPHGWSGIESKPCLVLVLHTRNVPDPLAQLAGDRAIQVPLNDAHVERLDQLAQRLTPQDQQYSAYTRLVGQHAVMELSLLAIEHQPGPFHPEAPDFVAQHKVDQAIAWHEEHLAESPTVADVARGVHMSESHLRRMFGRVGLGSPLSVFNRTRFERADELILGTDLKLAAIARMLGYSGPEAFHRAYLKLRGHPPGHLRRGPSEP